MPRIFALSLVLFLTLTVPARTTILDQARTLHYWCVRAQGDCVGLCIGHSVAASLIVAIFIPFGWLALLDPQSAFVQAHRNRIAASTFDRTRRSLKKLISFLKRVETAFAYLDLLRDDPRYLERVFDRDFKIAISELRCESESEIDVIKRIHTINQGGSNILETLDNNTDYYTKLRSTFCYRPLN